jgi:alkaline phosphatase D
MSFDRREFLGALTALGLLRASGASAQLDPNPRFLSDPFTLGVASGYPGPAGFALWTRLAPVPAAPGGGMAPGVVPVRWEVARDERMAKVVASGTAYATSDWAHSVHVEVPGLEPDRWYWYRFFAGAAASPIGRTRTMPGPGSKQQRMRFAVASCQHFEQGYFGAYRRMIEDEPDLAVFLGDYIYESSWGRTHVRKHGSPEPQSLDDYRLRHALYKSDPALRAAHAAFPWIVTWDDHEVENDYADDRSETLAPREWFLARRAAAYKAFYEHMPMRRWSLPLGHHSRIYARIGYGPLALFHVLDARQYRSAQSCPREGRGGSTTVDVEQCPGLEDPSRTMLGAAQESWLHAGLNASRARWNIIAQPTIMARLDQKPGPGRLAWTDGWDGYPAARRKLLDHLAARDIRNAVSVGGDVHSFNVSDLKRDFDRPESETVASEIVGTSITSDGWAPGHAQKFLPDNPHMKFTESAHRGYVRMDLTPGRATADLRIVDSVVREEQAVSTLATFVIENGKPGISRA